MENSVGLDCCDVEDGSPRLESPHGGDNTTSPDHSNLSPTNVDPHHHHHVALATAKIIERAGFKENTLLPNGKIKHRSDENGLINHVVLTGSPDTSGLFSVGGETADKHECFQIANASKNITNNQSASTITSNSDGDAHDQDDEDEEEDDDKGDSKPVSVSIQSRTYQSHGDQVDSITKQIDTLITTKNNTSATNIIINNTGIMGRPCCGSGTTEDNNSVDVKANISDDMVGLPSSMSPARADCTGGTVAVNNNNDNNNNNNGEDPLEYRVYECELQMADIMRLITRDLSEPYSIYTYRYFIHNWPKLCFLCMDGSKCVGAIVCKLDIHKRVIRRGYIAMLAVDAEYRRRKIGSNLVLKAIRAMLADGCDEVVLETEITNKAALKLYENLGFVRDKRLFRYYLNGVDALRLKLWLR